MSGDWQVEEWTDLECAEGRPVRAIPFLALQLALSMDGNDSLAMTVPTAIAATTQMRRVHRVTDPIGTVWEFRARRVEYDPAAETGRIESAPVLFDLATAGLVKDPLGSIAFGASLQPIDWIDHYFLAHAPADGLPWVKRGPVDVTAYLALSGVAEDYLVLMRRLQEGAGAEFRLVRVGGTEYRVALQREIGADLPVIRGVDGRNIMGLLIAVDDTPIATAVYPLGMPDDLGALADIASARVRVDSVPGSPPYWIPLRDPAGGLHPVQFDDQYVGKRLLLPDGTTLAIEQSRASDGAVRVAATTGLAAGLLVGFVLDALGTPLRILENPRGIAQYGRVLAPLRLPAIRGERNLVLDAAFVADGAGWTSNNPGGWPVATQWVNRPDIEGVIAVTGTNGSAALQLTGLPPHEVIRHGTRLDIEAGTVTIDATGYVSTSGTLTIAITASPIAISSGTSLALFNGTTQVGTATVAADVNISDTSIQLSGLIAQKNIVAGDQVRFVVGSGQSARVVQIQYLSITNGSCSIEVTLASAPRFGDLFVAGYSNKIWWTNGHGAYREGTLASDIAADAEVFQLTNVACATVWTGSAYMIDEPLYPPSAFMYHTNTRDSGPKSVTGSPPAWSSGAATVSLASAIGIDRTDMNDAPGATVTIFFKDGTADESAFLVEPSSAFTAASTSVALVGRSAYVLADPPAPRASGMVAALTAACTLRSTGQVVYASGANAIDSAGDGTIALLTTLNSDKVPGLRVRTFRPPDMSDGEIGTGDKALVLGWTEKPLNWRYSPAITVPASTVVRCRVAFAAWWSTSSTTPLSARFRLTNDARTVTHVTSADDNITIPTGVDANGKRAPVLLTKEVEWQSASTPAAQVIRVVLEGGPATGSGYTQQTAGEVYARWVMCWLGGQPGVPFAEVSHANDLFQRGLMELRGGGSEARQVRIRYLDLVRISGGQITETAPVARAERIAVESLGLTLRVVACRIDAVEPENSEVVCDVLSHRLTQTL